MWRKDYRLPKIDLVHQPPRAKRKTGGPRMGWDDVRNDSREIGTSWEGVKKETLNRLGWGRSMLALFGLRRLGAAASCL